MKKNVTYLLLSSDMIQKNIQLFKTMPSHPEQQELTNAFMQLATQDDTTLIIEKKDDQTTILEQDLIINPKSRKVLLHGEEVFLTPKEFDILYFLYQNKGEVFTKEQIYNAVWSEEYLMADSNIMAFIRKLRKKIEPDPDAPIYILTLWGVGYKFNENM
ncbi:MAG: winged helix-turn-helix domain-containing protein [Erysipelotrichaceae bacterium]|nr:winged helix-turn-helix domain-containing protein [Erysipelotrichaceae bacterium]MDY5251251.1 winged helix-turn-helix domain-containing protein [Erysipelotrichaceae bacterium]